MKYLLALITMVMFMASCKKEDITPPPDPPAGKDTIEQIIEIKTTYGSMYMWLNKETPLHRANFFGLADTGYFDSTTFHRCVNNFVIQGGSPTSKDADTTNDGNGGPGYTIPAEIDSSRFKHVYGAVGAARTNNPLKASSGCQFYIVMSEANSKHLNGGYTVFGKIIGGMNVAVQINAQPKNANDRPLTDIRMEVNIVERTRQQLRTEFNFEAN